MAQRPSMHGLKFEPCFEEALREIERKVTAGRELRKALVGSPFLLMLGNPYVSLFTVVSTDWDMLVDATNSVPKVTRERCYSIAALHSMNNPGGDLDRFWTAIAEAFSN